jgi:hypothetical protein
MCHTVRTMCSFRPDLILSREVSVPACIRPNVSAARPDAYQFSNGSLILSKFQEREDRSTVRTMWYPIRTRVSLRQELQFKINRGRLTAVVRTWVHRIWKLPI